MKQIFFTKNRDRLVTMLDGGLVVLPAYTTMQRSNDAAHFFDQEANFWYLSGVDEPDWWLIIDGSRSKSWLVAPDIDEVHRVFDGGLSPNEAQAISGVNEVISHKDCEALLRNLAKKHSVAFTLGEHPYRDHFSFVENPAQKKLTAVLERIFNAVQDCRKDLAGQRAIKQPEEIAAMKKAIRLTTDAFSYVKEVLPSLKYEYEVEAEFDYYFKKHGAHHAYDPIVASGAHACTLHYSANSAKLKNNSLLLMDIGARLGGYSADVTRTYVVGTPTKRQVEIHRAVETAHHEIIGLLKPGLAISLYQDAVEDIMKQTLIGVGLMKNSEDEQAYRTYFPHAVSHGLGIDTHDALGAPEFFREGMVVTVEPGIYIAKESIGVRIEDDILITKNGHENLSGRLSTGL
jgi:Xaa-Pro aminopeptidase